MGRVRTGEVSIAEIAHTPEALARLLDDKPACWPWAAFGSVLVQRRAAVATRLLEQELRIIVPKRKRLHSGREVRLFVQGRLADVTRLLKDLQAFDLTPAYVGAFGVQGDDSTVDAHGIVAVAHGLMDYQDQLIAIAEQYRRVSVPGKYAELLLNCMVFMDSLLDGFANFIDDYVERVNKLREFAAFARGKVDIDPVPLYLDGNSEAIARITDKLRVI